MENSLPIPAESKELFVSVNSFTKDYMSKYDSSHDYNHILRVTSNANRILTSELEANPSLQYDITAIFLATLLHDVGDHKYVLPGQDVENQISEILLERGASKELAIKVQIIAKYVSYSTEVSAPHLTQAALAQYPELAIVQDADRLDSSGAIGIGRCFTYGAAKRQDQSMQVAVDHFDVKLLKIGSMMKTQTGRQMAQERTERLKAFKSWWEEEMAPSF
ncbi:hypothetical protein K432DRAFT_287015 [Lepidopterella palustris CBS 459.81]|uniref:HD/PDEase domain-containing protein n=1 Tax=Lepidopterella palustris CBS 459.81 TaxID=1314670 RepID=A0A8E2EJS4_9PEZI|nr:hypothetical protein K432DRAFT_287015 [Lepidopterella palustris CBS 459.81]